MAHDLRYLVNCSILFKERALLERPAAAKAAGFDAVEFWWPFDTATPSDAEVDAFVAAVFDAGVQLVGLNFAAGDMLAGDRGLVSWPGRETEFRTSVDIACSIAERLGTEAFNALYGLRLDSSSAEEQDAVADANLAYAASASSRVGADVLLEPVSGAPAYPLKTASDVVAVLERIGQQSGARNLRLLCDVYHLAVNGDDLETAIATYAGRIGHVQIADAPGRQEPGTGELDLDGYLSQLVRAGYAGWVSLEYAPATTTEEGLGWLPAGRRVGRSRTPETLTPESGASTEGSR